MCSKHVYIMQTVLCGEDLRLVRAKRVGDMVVLSLEQVLALRSTAALGLVALGRGGSRNNGLVAVPCIKEERKPFVIPRP